MSKVLSDSDNSAQRLRILRQGQYFGEVGLVLDQITSAHIRLKTKSVLLYLEKRDFLKWASRTPQLLAELNIRTQAREVPLIHIMRHSKGYLEFLNFLRTELAPEGGIFWRAVDMLQDRCELWLSWRNRGLTSSAGGEDAVCKRRVEPNMSSSRVKIPYAASKSVVIVDPEHSHVTMADNVDSLLDMVDSIFDSHIKDMSIHQVNIPMTMVQSITNDYESFMRRARQMADSAKQGEPP